MYGGDSRVLVDRGRKPVVPAKRRPDESKDVLTITSQAGTLQIHQPYMGRKKPPPRVMPKPKRPILPK